MAHPIVDCCAPYPDCPCGPCQDRAAAEALVLLSKSSPESCPNCGEEGTYVSHTDTRPCNGCADLICTSCHFGARYFCPLLRLPPPSTLERSDAVGVQTPKTEEKAENK